MCRSCPLQLNDLSAECTSVTQRTNDSIQRTRENLSERIEQTRADAENQNLDQEKRTQAGLSTLQSAMRAEMSDSATRLEASIESSKIELAGSQKQVQMVVESKLDKVRNSLTKTETDLAARIESTDNRVTETNQLVTQTNTRITETNQLMAQHFFEQVERQGQNFAADLVQVRKDLTQATDNKIEGLRTDLKLTEGKLQDVEASVPRKVEESERKTERSRSTLADSMQASFDKLDEAAKQYVNRTDLAAKFAANNLSISDHEQKLTALLDYINGGVEETNDYDERIEALEDEVRELATNSLLDQIAVGIGA